jgi:DNA polymerase phi
MDDAAMFRIDKLLGEAFKSRQQDLMRKKNLKRATRDFKFRVISLFELYAKAQPGSAYLPGAAVTLLDATRECLGKQDPQSTQLAERLASLINKHIIHARDLPERIDDEVSTESLKASLKSCIVAANKGAGEAKVFNRAASSATAYLLRVLEAVSLNDKSGKAGEEIASAYATECFREALDMFKSKRSKLKSAFFSQMFARHPALASALIPELFGLVAFEADKPNARGEFLRLEALKLINPIVQSGRKRFPPLAKSVAKSIKVVSSSLSQAISAPYKNKNTRADVCQQVAVCIESTNRLIGDKAIKSVVDVDDIVGAIAKQMSKPPALPQKASKAFARICALLDRPVPDVEMRDTTEDDVIDDDSDEEEDLPSKKSKSSKNTPKKGKKKRKSDASEGSEKSARKKK